MLKTRSVSSINGFLPVDINIFLNIIKPNPVVGIRVVKRNIIYNVNGERTNDFFSRATLELLRKAFTRQQYNNIVCILLL